MIVTNFFEAFQVGKELANAQTWKNAQLIVNKLAAFGYAVLGILRAFGYDIGLTDAQVFTLASAVGVLVSMFNGAATVVSTTRVGVPARGGSVPPEGADGVRGDSPGGPDHVAADRPGRLDNELESDVFDMRYKG